MIFGEDVSAMFWGIRSAQGIAESGKPLRERPKNLSFFTNSCNSFLGYALQKFPTF
jgi:hypothetical protein